MKCQLIEHLFGVAEVIVLASFIYGILKKRE